MEEVLDLALSQLRQNTSSCTPLKTLNTYTELLPADMSCGNLIPISFASASSCPDSVLGPSCKAVTDLLAISKGTKEHALHSTTFENTWSHNVRVLDTLGSLTSQSTVAEQLAALRSIVAKDNVHLTSAGYMALAEGIFREAQNVGVSRMKSKHSLSGKQLVRAAEWHAFVSNLGVGKTFLKAAKRPFVGRAHPYQKKK
jgi:hypothetical protein